MKRRWLNEIEKALHPHGITVVRYCDGKKHPKIFITDGKIIRFIVTSNTPSEHRVIRNVVNSAKKALAQTAVQ